MSKFLNNRDRQNRAAFDKLLSRCIRIVESQPNLVTLRLCESVCESLTSLLENIRLTIEDRPRKNDLVMLRGRIQELSFERANESLNAPRYHGYSEDEEPAGHVGESDELHIYPNSLRTRSDVNKLRGRNPDRIVMHSGALTGAISDYLFNDVLGPMIAEGAVLVEGLAEDDDETQIFGSPVNDDEYVRCSEATYGTHSPGETGDYGTVAMTDIGTETPDYPIDVLKDELRAAVARLRDSSTRNDVTPYTLASIAGIIDTAVSKFDKEVGS